MIQRQLEVIPNIPSIGETPIATLARKLDTLVAGDDWPVDRVLATEEEIAALTPTTQADALAFLVIARSMIDEGTPARSLIKRALECLGANQLLPDNFRDYYGIS